MLESVFRKKLIEEIESMFPGCIVLKIDPSDIQGMPDLLVLYEDKWAALEVKRSSSAPYRPNQEYYIEMLDRMSFGSVIFPENKEVILNGLQRSFKS